MQDARTREAVRIQTESHTTILESKTAACSHERCANGHREQVWSAFGICKHATNSSAGMAQQIEYSQRMQKSGGAKGSPKPWTKISQIENAPDRHLVSHRYRLYQAETLARRRPRSAQSRTNEVEIKSRATDTQESGHLT